MVSYTFLKNFIGKKVLLNLSINENNRFYTGFLKESDDASESVLFEDKFKILMSVNASSVVKVEEFDENHKKNENHNHEEEKPPEPARLEAEKFSDKAPKDFLEPQRPRKKKTKEAE